MRDEILFHGNTGRVKPVFCSLLVFLYDILVTILLLTTIDFNTIQLLVYLKPGMIDS